MQYRHLGTSPLRLSAVRLGTMVFCDQTDRAEAGRFVAAPRTLAQWSDHLPAIAYRSSAQDRMTTATQRW